VRHRNSAATGATGCIIPDASFCMQQQMHHYEL
jgi:hypothetical protein